MSATKEKRKTGTREWAETGRNIQLGCEHDCLYCYAKAAARRFGKASVDSWRIPEAYGYPPSPRKRGVMFPTAHDITPFHLDRCEDYLKWLLAHENKVVIVSKPNPKCVERLLNTLNLWRSQVLWRFTIGSSNDKWMEFWEPGAPRLNDRLSSLHLANKAGWQTSVSMEPMLDEHPEEVVERVRPFVTESIWIGVMRKVRSRLSLNLGRNSLAINAGEALMGFWDDTRVLDLVARFQHDPVILWKDSIQEVIRRNGGPAS